jgi:cellulose synthase/poly-beta-1,6-N-acetylglucosamine synthase-like glycosyltransferase
LEKLFLVSFARDTRHVYRKIAELEALGIPYRVVCGERLEHPNVMYRPPNGKYDAINFVADFIPETACIVIMNDVDTKIHNLHLALQCLNDERVALVFGTEMVKEGPQNLFFRMLNPIRKRIPIAGSGELLLVRRSVLDRILPLKRCKAEDTYILFKVLEQGHKIAFCEECYAETERTKTPEKEEEYKRRTVAGIYQALSYTSPPPLIRVFYALLPFSSPLLLFLGKRGYFWMKGILFGFLDYLRGDRSGTWQSI